MEDTTNGSINSNLDEISPTWRRSGNATYSVRKISAFMFDCTPGGTKATIAVATKCIGALGPGKAKKKNVSAGVRNWLYVCLLQSSRLQATAFGEAN